MLLQRRMADLPTSSHLNQGCFAETPPGSGVQDCSCLAAADLSASTPSFSPAGSLAAAQDCHCGGCPTKPAPSSLPSIPLAEAREEGSKKKSWSGSFMRQPHKGSSKGGEPAGPHSAKKAWSGSFSGKFQRVGLTPSLNRDRNDDNNADESVPGCEAAISKDRCRSRSARLSAYASLSSASSLNSFKLAEFLPSSQASSALSSPSSASLGGFSEGASYATALRNAAASSRRLPPSHSEAAPYTGDSCCSALSISNVGQHGSPFPGTTSLRGGTGHGFGGAGVGVGVAFSGTALVQLHGTDLEQQYGTKSADESLEGSWREHHHGHKVIPVLARRMSRLLSHNRTNGAWRESSKPGRSRPPGELSPLGADVVPPQHRRALSLEGADEAPLCSRELTLAGISSRDLRTVGLARADSLTSLSGTDDISSLLNKLLAAKRVAGEGCAEGYMVDPKEVEMGAVIAVGASGEVSKAVYRGETVAVKILKGSFSKQVSRSVLTELRREVSTLIACSDCPQLLKFYGLFVDSKERVGIVTQFLPGGTLFKFLRRRRGAELATSQILRIARDIAQGMSFLHQEGVIHRDLKSENVLLDSDGRAVVCDFGMARLKGDRGDMTNEVGTYRWMAPEAFGATQWPVTHRADVYSFGVILWELVTLSIPFEDMNNMQAAMAVGMKGERPSIPSHCLPQLRRLIEQCWAPKPDHRPDFADILEALKRVPLV